MPVFQYEAMDNTGLEIKETIEAGSEAEAQQKIKEKGFFVTRIQETDRKKKKKGKGAAKKTGPRKKGTFSIGGVRPKHLCTFTRQLSTLQDAGLPILRSLRILEGQQKPGPLKNALMAVVEDIEGGSTLSEAMSRQPKAFDKLYVNMVKAGEAGGALEIILRRLAEFKEKSQSLKRKVQGAMIYPCAVIVIAGGIVAGIMIYIVPKFAKIFEDFGTELPVMTQMLIDASHWLATYWYFLVFSPILLWITIKLIRKNRTGEFILDWTVLKVPLLGLILRKSIIARTCRTMGTLIASGVPILECIIISRDTSGNAVFARAYDQIYSAIREGESMAVPLKETRITDDMVVNMVDVGEETGALDTMLYKVADVYEEEVEVLVEALVNMIEPIMVVVLGGAVGFIVIALFMPLIKLLNDLS